MTLNIINFINQNKMRKFKKKNKLTDRQKHYGVSVDFLILDSKYERQVKIILNYRAK